MNSWVLFSLVFGFAVPLARADHDPKRPVALISKDLGVSESEFIACFNPVKPTPPGQPPSKERIQANKKILLPCLQKSNPSITNAKLDYVMDHYRPGWTKTHSLASSWQPVQEAHTANALPSPTSTPSNNFDN